MKCEVRFVPSAWKAFKSLPREIQGRMDYRILSLMSDPRPTGCKPLIGAKDRFRIRIGDYRVIYQVSDQDLLVLVLRIAHRKDAYRKGF